MKLSLNRIKEFVDLSGGSQSETCGSQSETCGSPCETLDIKKIAYDLTMSTVEVEDVHNLRDDFDKMVVGIVCEITPHPDADKLVLCNVDIGEKHQIVCGGINLKEGMKVAVALPGAKVRWHGEGDLVELKETKVRGQYSYGMICASSEIGLFDLFPYTEEATIVDLSEFDAPAGTPLADALGLDDTILTIDNKSLTNRPDLWGHYGMARELSAIYDLPLDNSQFIINNLKLFGDVSTADTYAYADLVKALSAVAPDSGFSITIEEPDLCPRYIGVRLEGVSNKPAPFEIRRHLWSIGIRPINAIVDITNFVMLETGNPTHAFDADMVSGNIVVRRAKDKEKLLLLSGDELTLTPEDQVIADQKEAIALAGVMGGAKDSILENTQNVILEIANFNALTVRRTAMRYDVRTEAATRYEKGIDPDRAELTLIMAMRLFKELYPEMKITGFHDNYPKPLKINEIEVSQEWLFVRLGRKLSPDRIRSILERLGFGVAFGTGGDTDTMRVTVPSWRSTGDISIPDDIMEEIARIYGFENFEPTPIVTSFDGAINQLDVDIDRKIREYLAFGCGMNEIFTYPWVDDEYIVATSGLQVTHGTHESGMFEMTSPPSPAERYLRKSLIPGLCKAVADNLRYFDEFSIFESTQVFFNNDFSSEYDERESLPLQRRHVAGAFAAHRDEYTKLFKLAKGTLEAMPRLIHIEPFELVPESQEASCCKPCWADDVIYLAVTASGEKIGDIGLLSQKSALACGIKNAAVMLFELDIDALKPIPSRENSYKPAPEYPMTDYDISLLFDTSVKWSDIEHTARGKEGPDNYLRNVRFVEQYTGNKIPDDKKSVTLRLVIGSLKKTLKSDEIESCVNSAVKRLSKTLGGERR